MKGDATEPPPARRGPIVPRRSDGPPSCRATVCEKAGADSRAALNGLRWQAFRQVDRTVDNPLDPPKD
ncbi:MAG: hypothetical protein ACKOFF_07270, partial [Acidimicrobiales bacterium]